MQPQNQYQEVSVSGASGKSLEVMSTKCPYLIHPIFIKTDSIKKVTPMKYIQFLLIIETSLNVVLLRSTNDNSNTAYNTFYFMLQLLRSKSHHGECQQYRNLAIATEEV